MEFQVQLFLQEHRNGFFSLEVLGVPELRVYAEEVEKAREDLTLVLNDRLERSHPSKLSRFASPEGLRLETVELEAALWVEGAVGPGLAQTRVSALISKEHGWQRVWLPRWDVRFWIGPKEDAIEATVLFLKAHLKALKPHERLKLRYERREWLEGLKVDATPAPLERFTGRWRGAEMLPEPIPKEEDEKEPEEDDGEELSDEERAERARRKAKKRPPTPTLERIGVNLTKQAKEQELERAHGRRKEVEELLGLLQAPGASAFVVVGESGVGKTALLHELVYRVRDKSAPKRFKGRAVWFVDASRLVAGDGWFGDWQRQCLDVIHECAEAEVIWYIGNVAALLDAGKHIGSDMNVSLLLKPYLAGKRLTILGEATPRVWAQVELRDAGFARLFVPYRVEEPPLPEFRKILEAVGKELEDETGVVLRKDGLRAVEELCQRYSLGGSRLGTTLHFLRRLMDEAALKALDQKKPRPLGRAEVTERFCAETGLPSFLVRDDQALDPEGVWTHFRGRLIGQEEAVKRMTDLVALMKAGLSDQRKPLGSFLFVGPTGVGKTEMAKALAEFLFGSKDRMIRFDMSEFVTPDSVHRFLGDDSQEGALISQVRRSPFCVLLLDEVEKAHGAIFDVLLQVLGEARLTDQAGRTADFRNAVVLMTSNLGVETFKPGVGFGAAQGGSRGLKEHFVAEAERFFRPEFFNRIDHIVPFMPLQADAISQITAREVSHFLRREGLRQREVGLDLAPEVPGWLAQRGVEPRYGARPLKRLIERRLTAPLARFLSGTQLSSGAGIRVEADGEELRFGLSERKGGRKDPAATRAELLGLLDQIARTRLRGQRWYDSSLFRELCADLRLLDRLSQDKNFWLDQKRAEERLRFSQRDRDLQGALEEVRAQLASLEDLAYEAYHARNPDPIELLTMELDQLRDRFAVLELDLYARRFRSPDRAQLYLHASSNAYQLRRDLIRLYFDLAEARGWTLDCWSAREIKPSEDVLKAREKKALQAEKVHPGKHKEVAAQEEKKRKVRHSEHPEDWVWDARGSHAPRKEAETDEQWGRRVEQAMSKVAEVGVDTVVALRFEGPRAACLLSAESGTHIRVDEVENTQAKVLFVDAPSDKLLNPTEVGARWESKKRRTIHLGKHLIEDAVLGMTLPIEPRWYKLYERFMQAQIVDSVFGPKSHKLFGG
jgi:ATP-dependent Clp protease ATP-binding subunit ClpC